MNIDFLCIIIDFPGMNMMFNCEEKITSLIPFGILKFNANFTSTTTNTRIMKIQVLSLIPILLTVPACKQGEKKSEPAEKPNFLVFFVDDLRPELGTYGANHIHSPNIDRIASEGVQFDKAYCNVPVCGASRASLLTGLRPTPDRFITYYTRADEDAAGTVTMPLHFKSNGYYTVSYGKISHHGEDNQDHWSEKPWHAQPAHGKNWRDYVTHENLDKDGSDDVKNNSSEIAANAPDSIYIDGKTANQAVRKLRELKEKDQPFMFWVGFVKPHLPFNAPSKYWDMYDRDEIELAPYPDVPNNAPRQSIHNFGELRGYSDIPPKGPVSDEKALELRHGYYACVSYTDALIGQVLAELERLELDNNTIVAIFGDHGWNLGDHSMWCKHCNYNTAMQVPLIIKVPGKTKGNKTKGLVEFVDLYPTFSELAGLEIPAHTQGKSLVELIKEPEMEWKDPVYPRYVLGNSVVTEDMIYSEFLKSFDDRSTVSNMLYDHRTDPFENNNVVAEEDYAVIVDSLSNLVQKVHMGE